MNPKGNPNVSGNRESDDFPGYPHYGKEGDIYSNAKEEQNIDPENPNKTKPTEPPTGPPLEQIKSEEAGEFIEGDNQPGSQARPGEYAGETGDNNIDDDEEDLDDDDEDEDDLYDEDAEITEEDRLILDAAPLDPAERMANGYAPTEELDVPGDELDDDMEELGSEDEENNYYSVGGDRHER